MSSQLNSCEQLHYGDRVLPSRTNRPDAASDSSLCDLPADLPADIGWEYGDDCTDQDQSQTPHPYMYFFLINLSVVDVCYSSIFAPRLLISLAQSKTISYAGCITQHLFFVAFVSTEGFLLAALAYDRYVAVCNPLLYTVIMTKRVCIQPVTGPYLGGLLNSLTHTSGLLRLSFCAPSIINHFFCDTPAMLSVACSDIRVNELLSVIFSGVVAVSTFLIILISCLCILSSIIKICSSEGRYKTFRTCASHLTVVTLFYGPVSLSHLLPTSMYSQDQEKISAVFYTLVVPMLNPLIYSLRNKEVKDALKRVFYCRNE